MANRTIERCGATGGDDTSPVAMPRRKPLFVGISEGWRRWTFFYRERGTGRLREMGLRPGHGPSEPVCRWPTPVARPLRRVNCSTTARTRSDESRRPRRPRSWPAGRPRRLASSPTSSSIRSRRLQERRPPRPVEVDLTQTPGRCDRWRSKTSRPTTPEVIRPIWDTKQETASRVRQRIESILDAAKAQGLRSGDNPAAWRGNLKELMANPKAAKRVHHAAVPYDDMPAFISELRKRNSISALA